MHRKYSQAFEKLVGDKWSLVDMIAYSLYKSDKVEWIKTFEAQHNRSPSEEEIAREFSKVKTDKRALEAYRGEAEKIMAKLTRQIFEDEFNHHKQEIYEQAINSKIEDVEKHYKKAYLQHLDTLKGPFYHKSFWSGVVQSLIAAVIFVILLYILAIVISGSQINPLDLLTE